MHALQLPRTIADDPAAAELAGELAARARPLWPRGVHTAVDAELSERLVDALRSALTTGRLVRGLEGAERRLASEQEGLAQVDRRTGVARGGRVSRLLVLAGDGSERFYRSVDYLLRRHAPRVLALRLATDEQIFGERLFGRGEVARLVLALHKDAVAALLRALGEDWRVLRGASR